MATTSAEADPRLIAFTLPGIPESVPIARFRIRAVLSSRRLGEYADDAEAITSELVTNAIQHACGDGAETVGVTLVRLRNPEAVTVIVTDSSPQGPVKRESSDGSEQGRGLLIVDKLSVRWGWDLADGGKAVYATLAKEAARWRGVAGKISPEQCAIVGANIRILRQRNGWTQARLGELMGWPTPATVCAAEGHRGSRQRSFTTGEIMRLAVIFGVPAWQLTARCANCGGHPPAGFACLACGTAPGSDRPATSALPRQVRPGHAAASG